MNGRYERHIFVCLNERDAGDPRGCCHSRGAEEVFELLKKTLKERGLAKLMRANRAGCLDACESGVSLVIYPEGTWYGRVTIADVPEIIEKHLLGGTPVERLVITHHRKP